MVKRGLNVIIFLFVWLLVFPCFIAILFMIIISPIRYILFNTNGEKLIDDIFLPLLWLTNVIEKSMLK